MIRRSPDIPDFFRMALQVTAMALTTGVASGIWSISSRGGLQPERLLIWCLLTTLCAFALCLSIPLLKRAEQNWDRHGLPLWQRWVLFYGTFVVTGAIAGLGRNTLSHVVLGETSETARQVLDMALYSSLGVVAALLHDRIAYFHREVAAETGRIEDEVRRVFLSREALMEDRDHVESAVLAALMNHIEPVLDQLDARLQDLIAGIQAGHDPEEAVSEELMRQVDHLRDHEIRQLSHAIHPSVINVSLLSAVQLLVRRHQEAFAITLNVGEALRQADMAGQSRLSTDIRLNAYRCLERALENVAMHAQASHVCLDLNLASGMLVCEVSDDGIGFDPARSRPRSGLLTTEGRIAICQGTFSLQTGPGMGTRVRFEFPWIAPEPQAPSN